MRVAAALIEAVPVVTLEWSLVVAIVRLEWSLAAVVRLDWSVVVVSRGI
jgi:hypothetical protein